MPVSAVLGFWVVAALLIVVPGPDWAFAISAGLRGHVAAAAAGIVLGYLAMTIVAAAGVGALLVASPVAVAVLTGIGGAYLVWLGATTVAHPAEPRRADAPARPAGSRAHTLARGFGVSGLNPKGLLVFVVMLPQFTAPNAAWPITFQLGALGMVFTLTCAVVYLIVGASAQRVLRSRPGVARVVSRGSGICMIVIGGALLGEYLLG